MANGVENQRKETKLCKTSFYKDNENIAKQTLQQEMAIGINGLAHECNDV